MIAWRRARSGAPREEKNMEMTGTPAALAFVAFETK